MIWLCMKGINIFKGVAMSKDEIMDLNESSEFDDPVNQFILGANFYHGIVGGPDYKQAE